jgi:Family of unknown function (DUF6049)
VHGVLAAKFRRQTLSLAAAAAIAATAVLALAPPALAAPADAAGTGRVSLTITSMNPQFAVPGATVTLRGTVTNGTGQTQAGLEVQLATSATHFSSRDDMDLFLARGADSYLATAGNPFVIASVKPGATVDWTASFQVSAQGISSFGVYPVAVQLVDNFYGELLASTQTLLPFWSAQQTASTLQPLKIAWAWPLIDQPHHQVCTPPANNTAAANSSVLTNNTALTNNDLAASLSSGGRLSALLAAGMSHPDADLTWVVDPALLGDAATMTRPYQVDSQPDCTGGAHEPASKAAASWLSSLKTVTSAEPAVITPYANVDMTALVHQGLNADLASAYSLGEAVARNVLGQAVRPDIAWPTGGSADFSVLTDLAAAEGVGTVVLNSSEMPPAHSGVFVPDDAVTSIRTGTGQTMNVLLADNALTEVLRSGDSGSGALSPGAEFAVKQRFLAETAMIAAEAPYSSRSVVVAPPQDWSPSQALAGDLLSETASAPWLKPATLASLTTAPDAQRTVSRQSLPDSKPSPGELSGGYLSQVRSLGARLGAFESMLYHARAPYLQSLDEALAATESSAWRGEAAPAEALVDSLSDYLSAEGEKVEIITSAQEVPMAGSSGPIPVSIQNGLGQAIRVKVNATVANTPRRTSQLTVGPFDSVVVVQPGQAVRVKLPVTSAPQGSTVIHLRLTSPDGRPLPVPVASFTVLSTRYGRAILFLIGAAIAVMVLSSVYRTARRRLRDDSQVAPEEADPPGSVVTGTSARHPTEAPDDLADARRWADDA